MEEWVREIKERASSGKPLISSGRSKKLGRISFDDLVFIPAQLQKRPVDYFREEIVSETIIGKNSNKPLKLKIPILIPAMSFGALSKEAKIALAKASSIVGTATNTGEGGMLPEERKNAKLLIAQYSTGRFGVDEEYIRKADAIEIKIGQGAKPGCYTPDHEVFTEEGFKNVKDLRLGEKVWSVNPQTNELELAKVVKLHKYFYDGRMVQAKSRSIDFLVTPNHNLPIRLRNKGKRAKNKWKFITAEEALKRCEIRTSKKFDWHCSNLSTVSKIEIPKIEKTTWHQKEYNSFPLEEWLQLSAWFISEGFFSKNRRIEISQTNEENRREIKNLLSKMGIDFKERKDRILIYSKQVGKFLEKEFGNRSEEKKIPKWIRNLPQQHLWLFLKTLLKGGGTCRRRDTMTYFTSSEALMNNVVEIAIKLGKSVTIRKNENTYEIDIRSGKSWHGLSSKPKTNSWQKEATLKEVHYKGFVYCPQLDRNHTLIIKRNGKVSLNGNSGGLLPGEKVTEEIAKLRKVPVGKNIHSPPYHPDIKNIEDLKKKVEWLRELNDGPIIIKLGAGDVENDVKLAIKANPDAIAIDGMEGGTGAAPRIMLDDFGIPTLAALIKARRVLDKLKAKQELLIGGGLNKGADVAKALALGADATFMAFPLLIAMGCVYCKQCYIGKCPVGITTQDPELRKKLDVGEASKKVVNFLRACTEEVKMAAAACGKKNIHELNRRDLRSVDLTVSKITGIPLV
jgi:glutamate synthase domain-containing protein 2